MKKLQKLVFHKAVKMTSPQMKHITGGYDSTTCNKKACKDNNDCGWGLCANLQSPGVQGCIGHYCI